MSTQPLASHLRSYGPISDDEVRAIVACFEPVTFAKRGSILEAGQTAKHVYFTLQGCVRSYIHDFEGVEHNIYFSLENWWFGDLCSFTRQSPGAYHIQSLEPTEVLALSKPNWDRLLETSPGFVRYTRLLFRNTMFAHEQRILQNLSLTAEQRYGVFRETYPGLEQRVSQKHIASYLGITPEFLSMLRSKAKG